MTTALIADDEPLPRDQLRAHLAEAWPGLKVVAMARDGGEAIELALRYEPDIAFLDLRMPVKSGPDVARALGGRCHVVFVTGDDGHASAALAESAVDFLVKPAAPERVAALVARLKLRLPAAPGDLEALVARLTARGSRPLRWIRAASGPSIRLIAVDDVLYFQADDKTTRVVAADGEMLVRTSLRELRAELDPQAFLQVHRATIVNRLAIRRVDRDARGEPVIVLAGRDETLAVSRTFAHRFKAA
jgi:DNA-binding LytR/AlgR family response regulator